MDHQCNLWRTQKDGQEQCASNQIAKAGLATNQTRRLEGTQRDPKTKTSVCGIHVYREHPEANKIKRIDNLYKITECA